LLNAVSGRGGSLETRDVYSLTPLVFDGNGSAFASRLREYGVRVDDGSLDMSVCRLRSSANDNCLVRLPRAGARLLRVRRGSRHVRRARLKARRHEVRREVRVIRLPPRRHEVHGVVRIAHGYRSSKMVYRRLRITVALQSSLSAHGGWIMKLRGVGHGHRRLHGSWRHVRRAGHRWHRGDESRASIRLGGVRISSTLLVVRHTTSALTWSISELVSWRESHLGRVWIVWGVARSVAAAAASAMDGKVSPAAGTGFSPSTTVLSKTLCVFRTSG
jgi:hypothetical protein